MKPLDIANDAIAHQGPSFSLGNRLFRLVWIMVWTVLASWTPAPLHRWRCFLLRLFGAKVGRGAKIYGSCRVWYPPHLEAGDHAVIGWDTNIYCQGKIIIEDRALMNPLIFCLPQVFPISELNHEVIESPQAGPLPWIVRSSAMILLRLISTASSLKTFT